MLCRKYGLRHQGLHLYYRQAHLKSAHGPFQKEIRKLPHHLPHSWCKFQVNTINTSCNNVKSHLPHFGTIGNNNRGSGLPLPFHSLGGRGGISFVLRCLGHDVLLVRCRNGEAVYQKYTKMMCQYSLSKIYQLCDELSLPTLNNSRLLPIGHQAAGRLDIMS